MWDVANNRQNRCWVTRATEERCTDVVWHPGCVALAPRALTTRAWGICASALGCLLLVKRACI